MPLFTLPLICAALLLSLSCQTVAQTSNAFINPPLPGAIHQYQANNVYAEGSTINLQWTTTYAEMSLVIWQNDNSTNQLLLDPPTPVDTLAWEVDLASLGFTLDHGNVFFFEIFDGASENAFSSHYFNITAAAGTTASSRTSATITPSQTASRGTTASGVATLATSTSASSTSSTSTSTSAATSAASSGSSSHGLSEGATAGIGAGVVIGVAVLLGGLGLGIWLRRRRHRTAAAGGESSEPYSQQQQTVQRAAPPYWSGTSHQTSQSSPMLGERTSELSDEGERSEAPGKEAQHDFYVQEMSADQTAAHELPAAPRYM